MRATDITTDSHYIVRLGMWTELARVDAVTTRTVCGWTSTVYETWVYGLHQSRPLPASAFLHASLSPAEHEAIQAQSFHDAHTAICEQLEVQQARTAASPLRTTEPLTRHIHRQGTYLNADGDYGITR